MTSARVREALRSMRGPLVALARLGQVLGHGCDGGGGSGHREPAGVGCSGRVTARAWVQKVQGARARHSTPYGALCRAYCAVRRGLAAARRRWVASMRCLSHGSGLSALIPSATGVGDHRGAHRGLGSGRGDVQRRRRRGPVVGIDAAYADGSLQGCSGLLGSTGRLEEHLRRCYGGQGGPGIAGDEQLLGNGFTCSGGFE